MAIGLLLLYKSREEPVVATADDAAQPARPDAAPTVAAPARQAAVTQTVTQPVAPPPMTKISVSILGLKILSASILFWKESRKEITDMSL